MLIVTVRGMLSVQRRLVASAVKRAKNDWLFIKKARSVEAAWDVVKWFYWLYLEVVERYSERKSEP